MTNSEDGSMKTGDGTPVSSMQSKDGVMMKESGIPVTRNGLLISDETSNDTLKTHTPMNREGQAEPPLRVCDDCPILTCEGCPIAANPNLYRSVEKKDRQVIRRTWIVVFLAVVYFATMAYFVVGTHEVVNSHDSELTHIVNLQNTSNTNHDSTLRTLDIICAQLHVPDCPAPPVKAVPLKR